MEKYCPYNLLVEQINEHVYDYNENDKPASLTHKLIEHQKPTKCIKKACGVWKFGRCTRKS